MDANSREEACVVAVQIEVVEVELTCPEHGAHRMIVPAELPRPRNCAHCFLPAQRRELRRFTLDRSLAGSLGSEAFIG
jgi:hypothetical protein